MASTWALDASSEAGADYIETGAPHGYKLDESYSGVAARDYGSPTGYSAYGTRLTAPSERRWTGAGGYDSMISSDSVWSWAGQPLTDVIYPLPPTTPSYLLSAAAREFRVTIGAQKRLFFAWPNRPIAQGTTYADWVTLQTTSVDRRLRRTAVHLSTKDLAALPPELVTAAASVRSTSSQQVRDAVDAIMAQHPDDLLAAITEIDRWVCAHLTYDLAAEWGLDWTDMSAMIAAGRGVCFHYSGLFAGMSNAAGIPARVVYGSWAYSHRDGEPPNVTHSDIGHVWVEVYLPRIGWVEIEPQNMEDPNADVFFVDRFHLKGAADFTLTETSGPTAATNKPPIVRMTALGPAKPNQTIKISAAATDPDGLVSQVAFYQFTPSGTWEQIGTSTLPPYTTDWTPTQAGTYHIYAYAFDDLQQQSVDAPPVDVAVSASASGTLAPIVPDQLANISTRLRVGTGDSAMIGGFIVTAPAGQTKKVVMRAIGPSMVAMGVAGTLLNPTIELHDGTGAIVAANDDWRTTQVGGLVTASQVSAIQASGLAPGSDKESAIIANLPGGSYTVIVRGANGTSGVALVEVYDLDPAGQARLANISTRGPVGAGDNVMIGGTIVQGLNAQRIMVRASGPTLTTFGVPGAIADPTLELHDGNGALIATNDNWKQSDNATYIAASGLAPVNDNEAAIMTTVLPGNYTMIVRGANSTTGVALVEVFHLP